MTSVQTDDVRILREQKLLPPEQLIADLPLPDAGASLINSTRLAISKILKGEDTERLVAVVGPCSIHSPEAAEEYGQRLVELSGELADQLLIVMRVYFEKPRTTVGWKGLINDPDLNGSFAINKGLRLARGVLLNLTRIGLPTGSEFLDLITPQYLADLLCWGAIGARTTESQSHRELASGLSCPTGFKNGTGGSISIAVDAIRAARSPHSFLSVTKSGHTAIFSSSGNQDTHIILRGGPQPNYDTESVARVKAALTDAGLEPKLMIDMSHSNSGKVFSRQLDVCDAICEQLTDGEQSIIGVMIESNLIEGNQPIGDGSNLTYGQSITDACLGWENTERCLRKLAETIATRNRTTA